MENKIVEKISSHTVTLDNRKKVTLTAINEVVSATDKTVIAKSQNQTIIITGQDLRVEKLNLDDGELIVVGSVDSFKYQNLGPNKSFFKRLFK